MEDEVFLGFRGGFLNKNLRENGGVSTGWMEREKILCRKGEKKKEKKIRYIFDAHSSLLLLSSILEPGMFLLAPARNALARTETRTLIISHVYIQSCSSIAKISNSPNYFFPRHGLIFILFPQRLLENGCILSEYR